MRRPALSLIEIVAERSPQQPAKGMRRKRAPVSPETVPLPGAAPTDIEWAYRSLSQMESALGDLRSVLTTLQGRSAPSQSIATADQTELRVGYRLGEAAKLLGVSPRFLAGQVHTGVLPARITRRIIIISKAALDAYARGEAGQTESKTNV